MRRKRKYIRLRNFDYRCECSHYITICTKDRECFLGNIKEGKLEYSPIGDIGNSFWMDIPDHFPYVMLDEYIIMPNHMHGIIKLDYSITRTCIEPPIGTCQGMSLLSNNPNIRQKQFNKFGHPIPGSVSVIINHFKSAVKRWCNKNGFEHFLWQPRFYDHIVNNKNDLIRIKKYIRSNPAKLAQLNKI
jgi:REP element-mobilizing transposase RayT